MAPKQLKTTQRFIFTRDGLEKHFLLMPDEVTQILHMVEMMEGWTLLDAFSWFAGKNPEGISNLKLEVIYL